VRRFDPNHPAVVEAICCFAGVLTLVAPFVVLLAMWQPVAGAAVISALVTAAYMAKGPR
jgi:hypothetical protein